ncbi:MAG: hypothetical protein K2Y21_10020 [Phycisphaerales bacterium]|nr:hypothetical protein [Phycisphaerales bacterium]
MPDQFNRRQVLAAGVAGAASIAAARVGAHGIGSTVVRDGSAIDPLTLPPASMAFASLDPRFIGTASTSPRPIAEPVATALLRRVPGGESPGLTRRVRVLGCSAAPDELMGLCVDQLQPVGASSARRIFRRCVLAADVTGTVAPSAFAHPSPTLSLVVRSRGVERLATLSRRGVYIISLARRAPLWHSLRLASIPTGDGFTLALLSYHQPADVPCLLVAID